jgi:sugar phosphate isomerase/epimerase
MNKLNIAFSGYERIYASNIDRLIEVSDTYGIDAYELWIPNTIAFEDIPETEKKLRKAGKKVVCVTTWSHLYSKNVAEEQNLVIESIKAAKRLGAERINTYFGHYRFYNPRRAIDTYAKNLDPVLSVAEKMNIKICLENEFDSRGDDPEFSDITRSADLTYELVKKIDSPYFRLTFDPANSHVPGDEPYPYFYELLKEYIDYIHLKDVRKFREGDTRYRMWADHDRNYVFVPLGEGAVNFFSIFRALLADNYRGYLTMEPHIEDEDLLLDTYDKNFDFINKCLSL